MKIPWLEIVIRALLNSAFTAVALAALGYVGRSLIERWLTRNLEKYKAELQLAAFEHETRFTKLHEKRAEAIAELYKRLVQFQRNLLFMANSIKAKQDKGLPLTEADLNTKPVFQSMRAFEDYFRENRLYFAENVCDKIEKHLLESLTALTWLIYSQEHPPDYEYLPREELIKKKMEGVDPAIFVKGAVTKLNVQIPEIKREIEKEFREILGETES